LFISFFAFFAFFAALRDKILILQNEPEIRLKVRLLSESGSGLEMGSLQMRYLMYFQSVNPCKWVRLGILSFGFASPR
jgi:hypothetical protein